MMVLRTAKSLPALAKDSVVACACCAVRVTRPTNVRYFAKKAKFTVDEAMDILREEGGRRVRLNQTAHTMEKARYNLHCVLNLDSRLKTQRMEGTFRLPNHSDGKRAVLALTEDPDLVKSALKVGARQAGNLVQDIVLNRSLLRDVDRVIAASSEFDTLLSRDSVEWNILKRNRLLPTFRSRTLVGEDEFVDIVRMHADGSLKPYKTTESGQVHAAVGLVSTENELTKDNILHVVKELWRNRPPRWGDHPRAKKKNAGKFFVGMSLSTMDMDAVHIDLSSIDFLVLKQPVH